MSQSWPGTSTLLAKQVSR